MKFLRETVLVGQCMWPIPIWNNGQARRSAPRGKDLQDYGRIKINGLRWFSHRLSYHLNIAKIPRKPNKRKTNLILHKCDNRWCVNPEHLYFGSAKDNAIDNAARNHEWRRKRAIIQKKLGFPVISKAGIKLRGRKNSVHMKIRWKEKRELMLAIAFRRRKQKVHNETSYT